MTEYIRARHPCPEHDGFNDELPDERLPGCGETVLIEYQEIPPVEEGDVYRDLCPSCKNRKSRLEVVEVIVEE